MGLANAHSYEPLWQAHLADMRRQRKAKEIYDKGFRGLGDTSISDVIGSATSFIESVAQYLPTVELILQDPALPTVIQRVDTILSFRSATPSTPGAPPAPLGLSQFIPYLDAYVYVLQNPILPWIVGAGILLFIGGIGYSLGRR